jgi:hypothetical protein
MLRAGTAGKRNTWKRTTEVVNSIYVKFSIPNFLDN